MLVLPRRANKLCSGVHHRLVCRSGCLVDRRASCSSPGATTPCSETTSDSSTACDVDRRMLRNWRNVAKQLDKVLNTWVRMDMSISPIRLLLACRTFPKCLETFQYRCRKTLRHRWAPVPKCLGHFGTKYRCRSVLGPKCPGAEVSVKRSTNR